MPKAVKSKKRARVQREMKKANERRADEAREDEELQRRIDQEYAEIKAYLVKMTPSIAALLRLRLKPSMTVTPEAELCRIQLNDEGDYWLDIDLNLRRL